MKRLFNKTTIVPTTESAPGVYFVKRAEGTGLYIVSAISGSKVVTKIIDTEDWYTPEQVDEKVTTVQNNLTTAKNSLQTQIDALDSGRKGGIAHSEAAPTVEGIYFFTSAGTCSWITAGARTVDINDEVWVHKNATNDIIRDWKQDPERVVISKILPTDPAPTVPGLYEFTASGTCTWITAGSFDVNKDDNALLYKNGAEIVREYRPYVKLAQELGDSESVGVSQKVVTNYIKNGFKYEVYSSKFDPVTGIANNPDGVEKKLIGVSFIVNERSGTIYCGIYNKTTNTFNKVLFGKKCEIGLNYIFFNKIIDLAADESIYLKSQEAQMLLYKGGDNSAVGVYTEAYGFVNNAELCIKYLEQINTESLSEFLTQNKNILQKPFLGNVTTPNFGVITIIADSIGEGVGSTKYDIDGWAGIFNRAIQIESSVKNYGFCNFNGYNPPAYHSLVFSGFTNNWNYDGTNSFGGVGTESSANGSFIEASFTGKQTNVVFKPVENGGIIEIYLDGVLKKTVSTAGTEVVGFSGVVEADTWGLHTLKILKTDANHVVLNGVIYTENSAIYPQVYNVSRSAISMHEISDSILDRYVYQSRTLIIALGTNDAIQTTDINTFEQKYRRLIEGMIAKNGNVVMLDTMANWSSDNAYKQCIKRISKSYPQFIYIDFAEVLYGETLNYENGLYTAPDKNHPVDKGHETIANYLFNALNLNYSKKIIQKLY